MTLDIKRILLTGGGSGGHVYPLIAVAQALKRIAVKENVSLEMHYLGPRDQFTVLLENLDVKTHSSPAGKIRRYLSPLTLIDIPKVFFGFIVALWKIYWIMPDAVFSKGGTGAFPVVVAAWFYRIPVIIHESDAKPGLNNLLSAPFASRIAVSFESALKYFNSKKVAWIGTPIREELASEKISQEEAKENFGFSPQEPLLLVLGGSLGSERINNFILANLPAIANETQVLHQTGQDNYKDAEKLSRAALIDAPITSASKTPYKPAPYFADDMKLALTAADVVVSRAGSGMIFEIAAFGKPAILIPLPESAGDHQRENAYELSRRGAAIVVEESNLLPAIFLAQLRLILKNSENMKKMSQASRNFFKQRAAEVLAEELLRLAS